METLINCNNSGGSTVGSYRTYEEWKQDAIMKYVFGKFGSYRTYEEWKPVEDWVSQDDVDGSYRTYEEWKPHDKDVLPNGQLKFLPYL